MVTVNGSQFKHILNVPLNLARFGYTEYLLGTVIHTTTKVSIAVDDGTTGKTSARTKRLDPHRPFRQPVYNYTGAVDNAFRLVQVPLW